MRRRRVAGRLAVACAALAGGCATPYDRIDTMPPARLGDARVLPSLSSVAAAPNVTRFLNLGNGWSTLFPLCPMPESVGDLLVCEGARDRSDALSFARGHTRIATPRNASSELPPEGESSVLWEDYTSGRRTMCAGGTTVEDFSRMDVDARATTRGRHSQYRVRRALQVVASGTDRCRVGEVLWAAADYEGTIDFAEPSSPLPVPGGETPRRRFVTYNGSGRFASADAGSYTSSTENEVWDTDRCRWEPLSGTQTLSAGGHVAVITFDGATDCSEELLVNWAYDGVPQGRLSLR